MSDWQDEYDDVLIKRGRIIGLREAAEMCDGHGAPMPVGAHHIHERILARIAELEQKS